MKNLEALNIFTRVAEMKSFTQAAESLGIQKGRVSTVVRELERDLGATLLHRTTRTVQLTEDGRAFYSRARLVIRGRRTAFNVYRCRYGTARSVAR